jgi:hypothetical protein
MEKGGSAPQRLDLCNFLSCHTVEGLGGLQDRPCGLREHQQDASDQGEAEGVCHGAVSLSDSV